MRFNLNQTTFITTEIPVNEYYEYFGPNYTLDVKASNMENLNTPQYLNRVRNIVMENLRGLGGPPSVQMQGPLIFYFMYISYTNNWM